MKPASIKELKEEVQMLNQAELADMIMRLARFKKENKELLTYLLLYNRQEEKYVSEIKESLHVMFTEVNVKSAYITKKNLRKILRTTNRFIKYTTEKSTEVELLIFFVEEFNELGLNISRNATLQKLKNTLLLRIEKTIMSLHEDLQYDFNKKLQLLNEDA